jgi:phosphoribosylamine-glycine ligase
VRQPIYYEDGRIRVAGIWKLMKMLGKWKNYNKDGELISNGGRVLNVVHTGKTLQEAIAKCYSEVKKIKFKDLGYRKDIGSRN